MMKKEEREHRQTQRKMDKKTKTQKEEIIWNIVNSFLAAGLVFIGAISNGDLTIKGIIAAICAGGLVAITQFKKYWSTQEDEYTTKIFSFIN